MVQSQCQLWMGSLEPYMTETFIMTAFQKSNEYPIGVKLMRGKNQAASGYAFVSFHTEEQALEAMHKLNGKVIPGSEPTNRFRLNTAGTGRSAAAGNYADSYSVWVGDLSSDVDDFQLYRTFAIRYNTIKTAKVVTDNAGFSRGYGFVKFRSEDEQKHCLQHMNGFNRLGSKPLRISSAVPKFKGSSGDLTSNNSMAYQNPDFSTNQYFDASSYWQNYASWQGYYDQTNSAATQQSQALAANNATQSRLDKDKHKNFENDLDLIEHSKPTDVDQLNAETFDQDRNLWDALESSKWLLCGNIE